jgi:hydroxymethylglutaryl-CoA reductase
LGLRTANDLAKVMAAAGLAQNLGALRALATVGIQAGHMKLHLMNMVAASGAEGGEIEAVAKKVRESGERITMAVVERTLSEIRGE